MAKYQKTVDAIANHIQKEYKGGPEIAKAIRDLSLPMITIPKYRRPFLTTAAIDQGEVFLWQQNVTKAKKRNALLAKNKKRLYTLTLGQCSPGLESKIKGMDSYVQADCDQDVVQLLLIIRGYCCRFDDNQQSIYVLESAKHRVLTYYQGYEVTITEYVEHFKALVGPVETYGGAYGNKQGPIKVQLLDQGVSTADVNTPNADKLKKTLAMCYNSYLLCMTLQGSDNSRFYQLKTNLVNDMTKGQDNLPKTIVKMTCLLNNYKVPAKQQHIKGPNNNGVAFVKNTGCTALLPVGDILCWHCKKKGHYRSDCHELQVQEINVGFQNLNIDNCEEGHGLFLSKKDKGLAIMQDKEKEEKGVQGIVSKYHLFIDTCASYAGNPNCKLLENVELQEPGLVGHRNTGLCGMDTARDMGAIKQMWLNEGRGCNNGDFQGP
jgi:hypothetical protein